MTTNSKLRLDLCASVACIVLLVIAFSRFNEIEIQLNRVESTLEEIKRQTSIQKIIGTLHEITITNPPLDVIQIDRPLPYWMHEIESGAKSDLLYRFPKTERLINEH